MPKALKPEIGIELTCSLCPKNPDFSDISHLLTHISSKSHLAHRFKLQIRAQSEIEAKVKLDTFDYWYLVNNIDALLSERMAAKEQKKSAKERKIKVSHASTIAKRNAVQTNTVKAEPKPSQEALAATPIFRAPVPRMHLWPTNAHISSPTPFSGWEQNNLYETPTMRRSVPNFAPAAAKAPADYMSEPKSVTPSRHDMPEGTPQGGDEKCKKRAEKKIADSPTLKGVLWPGMDLFDSATPEMKRMRNQRKDDTVLEQMLATSNGVEATEVVYDLKGDMHHSRDIFGPLSTENSPIQDPTPKRRKSRKTVTAMSDISVNVPRIRAPRTKRTMATGSPLKRELGACAKRDSQHRLFVQGSIPNPLVNFGQRYVPTSEEDEEFRMNFGDITNKRSFGIFKDAPEVSPGKTESTLEDHRFDLSADRATEQEIDLKSSNHVSPTPATRQRGFGKENEPSGLSPIRHRQAMPAPAYHVYPGQVFYDPILNPLYDPTFARSFPTYFGQQRAHSEDLKPLPPRFHSALHGPYRPMYPISHLFDQQGQGAEPGNSGQEMHYDV